VDAFRRHKARRHARTHRFLRDWRNAKLLELAAIADGDQELGGIAARHIRNGWQRRVWGDND